MRLPATAYLNKSRTAASLAPMYLFSTSGPDTAIRRSPAAAAAARTVAQHANPWTSKSRCRSSTPLQLLSFVTCHANVALL